MKRSCKIRHHRPPFTQRLSYRAKLHVHRSRFNAIRHERGVVALLSEQKECLNEAHAARPFIPGSCREGTAWVSRIAVIFILLLTAAFFFVPITLASIDIIHLRDGQTLKGRVLLEQRGIYTVQAKNDSTAHLQIPQKAVKFVIYADQSKADQYLGLTTAAQSVRNAERATAHILPTEAFGEAIVEAARNATESIWITVYYISGSEMGVIGEFYKILCEKARSGVEVVLICEFSAGTRPAVRHATLNFASELAQDGIEILFLQEHRSMHKKMIIVDGQTVLLGSSNLTLAGTSISNEMNVQIEGDRFSERTMSDFTRLRERAIPASDLR